LLTRHNSLYDYIKPGFVCNHLELQKESGYAAKEKGGETEQKEEKEPSTSTVS